MTRFNYLTSPFERAFGVPLPERPALSRRALAGLAAACAFATGLAAVQLVRLHVADADAAVLAARRAAMSPALDELRRTEAALRRAEAAAAALRAVRRSGSAGANEIAAIGNALPADAWLTGLRFDAAAVVVDGRGARLRAVAGALDGLARVHGVTAARLTSARLDPLRADVVYAIAMERRR